jgi:hypothetical protein
VSNLTDRLGGARASLAFKAPCRVASTANVTLSGFQVIDGITLASTDEDNGYNIRVLLKNQTTASENGIWIPSTGAWTRAKDMDGSLDVVSGTRVYVAGGSTGSGGYVITTSDPITIGTTSLTFVAQATADISFGSLTELTAPDPDADLIPIVDASAGTLKNIKYETLAKYNSDGTAALPAIAFESDLTKGMYSAGSNLLGWAISAAAEMILSATALYPATSDGNALGSSTNMWGDLFLASGAVVNFNNGDVTVTHAANALTFAGATSGYTFNDGAGIFGSGATFSAAATPTTNDAAALGSSSLSWSDLFLASGAVINWNSGGVTITEATDALAFAGASNGYTFSHAVLPASSDGAAIGSASVMWSDLFLASGAVINFNNGDVTLTHSANALAFAGASSGYTFDAAAVVTSAGASALAVGANGATNPVLKIDASASSVATGIAITGAAAASRALLAAISSGTDEGLSIDAKGAGTIRFGATSTGAVEFSRNAVPTASDGAALGTSSLMWSDLFLASGAVVNFNNGDVTLTHSADVLAFAGAASGYTFTHAIFPSASDGAAIGSASVMWSDLFLASGGVINFNNGNAAITHSTGALAVTGTLDIQQGWKLSGDYSDSWAGNQDNYNGGGDLANVTLIRVDGGASSRDITGMTGGADGLIRIFQNVGATNNIVLKNETTSTAANRFSLGADVTLTPSQGAIMRYDGTLSRWTAIGVFTTAGAASGTVTSVASGFGMNFATITTSGSAALNAGLSAAVSGAF